MRFARLDSGHIPRYLPITCLKDFPVRPDIRPCNNFCKAPRHDAQCNFMLLLCRASAKIAQHYHPIIANTCFPDRSLHAHIRTETSEHKYVPATDTEHCIERRIVERIIAILGDNRICSRGIDSHKLGSPRPRFAEHERTSLPISVQIGIRHKLTTVLRANEDHIVSEPPHGRDQLGQTRGQSRCSIDMMCAHSLGELTLGVTVVILYVDDDERRAPSRHRISSRVVH
jgi:hypothetical protein